MTNGKDRKIQEDPRQDGKVALSEVGKGQVT
jgi:hypothetical protein